VKKFSIFCSRLLNICVFASLSVVCSYSAGVAYVLGYAGQPEKVLNQEIAFSTLIHFTLGISATAVSLFFSLRVGKIISEIAFGSYKSVPSH
jgi:hypothetical protein